MRVHAVVAVLAAFAAAVPAAAAERALLEWAGFLQPELRASLAADPVWLAGKQPEAGLELRAFPSAYIDAAAALHLDVEHGERGRTDLGLDLRELWVRLYDGSYTLVAGRQIYTWSTLGEYGVIDVVNPQQWHDTTQLWMDRKLGVWSLQGVWESSLLQLQAVLLPVFAASQVPAGSPFVRSDLPPAVVRSLGSAAEGLARSDAVAMGPDLDLRETDAFVRAYFPVDVGDFSLAAGLMHHQVGSLQPVAFSATGVTVERRYGRVGTVSAAATVPFLEAFSLGLESILFMPQDVAGNDPWVRNLTLHSAAQLKGWVSAHMQLSLGVLDEQILRDGAPGESDDERAIPPPAGSPWLALDSQVAYAGMLVQWGDTFHRFTLTYMAAYLHDGHLIQPELNFGLVDGLRLKLGGQWFAGPRQYGFGRADDFSNAYVALRADF